MNNLLTSILFPQLNNIQGGNEFASNILNKVGGYIAPKVTAVGNMINNGAGAVYDYGKYNLGNDQQKQQALQDYQQRYKALSDAQQKFGFSPQDSTATNQFNPAQYAANVGKTGAEAASFAVPFGQGAGVLTKATVPGLAAGALSGVSKDDATPQSVLTSAGLGGLFSTGIYGLGKLASNIAGGIQKDIINPKVAPGDPFGAQKEAEMVQGAQDAGLTGSAEHMRQQIPAIFNDTQQKIVKNLSDSTATITQKELNDIVNDSISKGVNYDPNNSIYNGAKDRFLGIVNSGGNNSGITADAAGDIANGWQPGIKKIFDQALMDGDKATVNKFLAQVPDNYLQQFGDKISEVTGKSVPDVTNRLLNFTPVPEATPISNTIRQANQQVAAQSIYKMKQQVGDLASKAFDRLANPAAGPLTPAEEVAVSTWEGLQKALEKTAPEVNDLTQKESLLYKLSPGLYKSANKAGGIGFGPLKIPISNAVQQTINSGIGQGLQSLGSPMLQQILSKGAAIAAPNVINAYQTQSAPTNQNTTPPSNILNNQSSGTLGQQATPPQGGMSPNVLNIPSQSGTQLQPQTPLNYGSILQKNMVSPSSSPSSVLGTSDFQPSSDGQYKINTKTGQAVSNDGYYVFDKQKDDWIPNPTASQPSIGGQSNPMGQIQPGAPTSANGLPSEDLFKQAIATDLANGGKHESEIQAAYKALYPNASKPLSPKQQMLKANADTGLSAVNDLETLLGKDQKGNYNSPITAQQAISDKFSPGDSQFKATYNAALDALNNIRSRGDAGTTGGVLGTIFGAGNDNEKLLPKYNDSNAVLQDKFKRLKDLLNKFSTGQVGTGTDATDVTASTGL